MKVDVRITRQQCKAGDTVRRLPMNRSMRSRREDVKNCSTIRMPRGHVLAVKLARTDTTLDQSLVAERSWGRKEKWWGMKGFKYWGAWAG